MNKTFAYYDGEVIHFLHHVLDENGDIPHDVRSQHDTWRGRGWTEVEMPEGATLETHELNSERTALVPKSAATIRTEVEQQDRQRLTAEQARITARRAAITREDEILAANPETADIETVRGLLEPSTPVQADS